MNRKALFRLSSLPPTAAALLALGAAGNAFAQSAANGETLYKQKLQPLGNALYSCEDCHGIAAANRPVWAPGGGQDEAFGRINTAINAFGVMAAYRAWTAAQRQDVAAYVIASQTPPPPPPPPGAPIPTATPDTLNLGTNQVGVFSATRNITITNVATTGVTFTATQTVLNSGPNASQFRLVAPSTGIQCQPNMTLAPNATCNFGVQHQPASAGSHTATWTINFSGSVQSRLVALQAMATTGPAPAPTTPAASPDTVAFNATSVGQQSAISNVMLTNSNTSAVTFGAQLIATGTGNTGDFMQATPTTGTACAANAQLGAGMSCTIGVRFAPTGAGNRTATWNVQFTGGVPVRALTLQGTATAASTPSPGPAPAPSAPAPAPADSGGATGPLTLAGLLGLAWAATRRRAWAGAASR